MTHLADATEARVDALFAAYDRPQSPGYAVGILHGGEFLYRRGFGHANLEHPSPITAETVFDVGSMAKMVTGRAVALLEQEGRLDVDAPLRAYLPDFPAYAEHVTVAHLIHHASGVRSYAVMAYYMMGCHECDAITSEQVYDLLRNQTSLSFAPGSRWEYSDSNYFLLGAIVARVTGQTLGVFAHEALFAPLGMAHTTFRARHSDLIPNRALGYVRHPVAFRSPSEYRPGNHPGGQPPTAYHTLVSSYEHVGAEGLYTTLDDLARWARSYTDHRLGGGDSALIERVLTPGVPRICSEIGYGFGINVGTHRGRAFFGHDGAIHGYTSTLMHFPDDETTIICLSNHDTRTTSWCRDRIMDLIFEDCVGRPPPAGAACRTLPRGVEAIAGPYQDVETAAIWELRNEQDRLVALVNGTRERELLPMRPHVYGASDPSADLELVFVLDEHGVVTEVRGNEAGVSFVLQPFVARPLGAETLAEYVGSYRCEALETRFHVDVVETRIRLRNGNRHYCGMDLVYEPTIRDSFVAYDPHPGTSQITFLREAGRVHAFAYRDPDGDRREDLEFLRTGGTGA